MAQATGLLMKYDPNFCFSMTVGSTAIVANKIYKRHTDDTLIVGTANFDGPLFYPLTVEGVGYDVEAALVGYCTIPVIASGAWTQGCALAAGASGTVKAADGNDRVIGRALDACDDGAVGVMIPPAGESAVLGDSMIVTSGNSGAMVAGAVTVADTAILTGDLVIFSRRTTGGTAGHVAVSAFTSATSFVLTSSSNTETSTFDYVVLRPVA